MRIGLVGAGRIGAMHAEILAGMEELSVTVADADAERARSVADKAGLGYARSVDELLDQPLDGVVIAAATNSHPTLIRRAVERRVPVFCEKPVAPDVAGTLEVIAAIEGTDVPVQIGFQRRFDAGYVNAREEIASGRLGWLHTLRSTTLDPAPPPEEYVASSGGIFIDCAVHDFDSLRWVTGREVASVYATGSNRGAPFFTEHGDVDTASATLRFDDDALAVVSVTRYNAAGYDIRLEAFGSDGSVSTGLDDKTPLRSTEPGSTFPSGPAYTAFPERFADAYVAELAAFVRLAHDGGESPCAPVDALEAFYIAEACEMSRTSDQVVYLSGVRR
ncbi:Gfo/Idh/MocA family protein [Solicola gregarius]|uniref:Gfo/Idh/MocA family oxidoreductase n=1 Tax=Solicola gregarius TaxID=2908642 RepID=A0AA46THJ7_9ACTN|nr:Gfo/Idh/MocA family oxidoreductase [Solicola gregarius]UYM05395.1 Gfo/Idh/MocA family oxidoreductase [Solicola gregarius]